MDIFSFLYLKHKNHSTHIYNVNVYTFINPWILIKYYNQTVKIYFKLEFVYAYIKIWAPFWIQNIRRYSYNVHSYVK